MKYSIKSRWDSSKVVFEVDDLRAILNYDPASGKFSWRARRSGGRKAGTEAGSNDGRGYLQIKVCGRNFKAHRLAWFHVYGEWPPNQVDHINGDKMDNRLSNLRLATSSQNNANRSRQANNTSGATGVCFKKATRKWVAQIRANKKLVHLGYFSSFDAATEAYRKAAVAHFGEFALADMKRLAEQEAARVEAAQQADRASPTGGQE